MSLPRFRLPPLMNGGCPEKQPLEAGLFETGLPDDIGQFLCGVKARNCLRQIGIGGFRSGDSAPYEFHEQLDIQITKSPDEKKVGPAGLQIDKTAPWPQDPVELSEALNQYIPAQIDVAGRE